MRKKKILWMGMLIAALAFTGCGDKKEVLSQTSQIKETQAATAGDRTEPAAKEEITSSSEEEMVQAVLYIGMGEEFREYEAEFEQEPGPDMLIEAIAEQTGWNLALSEPVTTGKGGMTVVFAKESSIFTGPPELQKEEFHVFEASELIFSILDSIQKTLQKNYVNPELGDPSSLDIYFAAEGGENLSFPDSGLEFPMDEPYKGSSAYTAPDL